MVFYVLSRRIFDYNFKNNEATGFIVSELFFDMSINIAAKFLFYQLKLLKILSLTAVPRTRFHENFVRKLHFNDVEFWFVIVRYFVLLNNYITLGLQKHEFLIKSNIRHFSDILTTYGNYATITLRLGLSIYCIFSYVRIML